MPVRDGWRAPQNDLHSSRSPDSGTSPAPAPRSGRPAPAPGYHAHRPHFLRVCNDASPASASVPAAPVRCRLRSAGSPDTQPECAGFPHPAACRCAPAPRHPPPTESVTVVAHTRPSAACGIQGEVAAPASTPSPFYRPVNAVLHRSRSAQRHLSAPAQSPPDRWDQGRYPVGSDRDLSRFPLRPPVQCGQRHRATRRDSGYGRHRFLNRRWAGPLQCADNRKCIFLICRFSS